MDKFIERYVNTKPSENNCFIWNMVGSSIFAATSMLLSLYVIRMLGPKEGGVFSIAITVAQMLAFIEYYEIRTFQVTDVNNKYTFFEYRVTKIVLLGIAIVFGLICSWQQGGHSYYKITVIFLMCVYRYIDGYADLYEGTFQNSGRLDLAGKSQAYRTIWSVSIMAISIILFQNLIIACAISIIAAILGVIVFDIKAMKHLMRDEKSCNYKNIKNILMECFPMFCGSFLWTYILSASRMAVNVNMSSEFSAYYQTLFLPVSIINLCATFVMKPLLPKLAQMYSQKKKELISYIVKILFIIVIFSILCMIGAFVIGEPVLSILTGCNLKSYRNILVILMLAGGINSLAYFGYYLLSIMRKNSWIFCGYITSAICALLSSHTLVKISGLWGATCSFIISVVILLLIFCVGCATGLRNNNYMYEKREKNE